MTRFLEDSLLVLICGAHNQQIIEMKEIVCDTNIFYRYISMYKSKSKNYLPSFYNFEDLLASKNNLTKLNSRLRSTLKNKLAIIHNHDVLIFEPHYYIIKEIFPNSKYARPLFNRIDETNPNSYINCLSAIMINGSNINHNIKQSIISFAANSSTKKISNNQEAMKFAKKTYKEIGYKNTDDVNYKDFVPYVEDLQIKELNRYRNLFMLHTGQITKANFEISRYELFINTFSRYLSTLVGKEGESSAPNDNIDALILLYVNSNRKFMGCEKKWLQYIKDVGLHKKYLEPYAKSYFKSCMYKAQLFICGKVIFQDCE